MFQVVGCQVAAVEADGQTPVCGADGVTSLTFDEWVTRQVAEAPHLFESNAGGGAVGNGSGGVGQRSGRNPFRRGSDWNLTGQMRLQRTDPQLAGCLRASACRVITGPPESWPKLPSPTASSRPLMLSASRHGGRGVVRAMVTKPSKSS